MDQALAATIYGSAKDMKLINFSLKPCQTLGLVGACLLTSLNVSVYAKPFVEKSGRFEWNWSTMKLRFYGESSTPDSNEPFANIRQKAWQEGLLSAKSGVAEFHKNHLLGLGVDPVLADQSGQVAGNRTSTATWSLRSEYFSDGSVRIHMESSLPRALHKQDLIFSNQKPESPPEPPPFTGLVLRSTKAVSPKAYYKLVDESGVVLFSAKDVSKESYEKNLMGRWFIQPERYELTRAVGSRPVSLEVTPLKNGDFRIQRSAWEKAMKESRSLLQEARVAIAIPGTPSGG